MVKDDKGKVNYVPLDRYMKGEYKGLSYATILGDNNNNDVRGKQTESKKDLISKPKKENKDLNYSQGFDDFKNDMLDLVDKKNPEKEDPKMENEKIEGPKIKNQEDTGDKIIQTKVKKMMKYKDMIKSKPTNKLNRDDFVFDEPESGAASQPGLSPEDEDKKIAEAVLKRLEEDDEEIIYVEKRLKILYDTFNLMTYSDKLPLKVTRFIDKIMPREFYSKEITDLLNTWPDTVEILYEANEFSMTHLSKDKEFIVDYMTPKQIFMLSNPFIAPFVNLFTFLNPPITRVGYLASCLCIHAIGNAMAFKSLIEIPIDRDYGLIHPFDSSNLTITFTVSLLGFCLNLIMAFFIFTKDKLLVYPRSLDELFTVKNLVEIQNRLSLLVTCVFAGVLIPVSFMTMMSLTESHG